jgi:hypothetical protein
LNLDERHRTENEQTGDQEQPFLAHGALFLSERSNLLLPIVPVLVNETEEG